MHHENGSCRIEPHVDGDTARWHLYDGVPDIVSRANGVYTHDPAWYRNFLYTAERERGLDDSEDLLSPGTLTFDLGEAAAVWMLSAGAHVADGRPGRRPSMRCATTSARDERRLRRRSNARQTRIW